MLRLHITVNECGAYSRVVLFNIFALICSAQSGEREALNRVNTVQSLFSAEETRVSSESMDHVQPRSHFLRKSPGNEVEPRWPECRPNRFLASDFLPLDLATKQENSYFNGSLSTI